MAQVARHGVYLSHVVVSAYRATEAIGLCIFGQRVVFFSFVNMLVHVFLFNGLWFLNTGLERKAGPCIAGAENTFVSEASFIHTDIIKIT